METLITVLHVVVSAFLVLVVLLQSGSADMGTSFGGGGSGSVLGAAGANKFMTRLTGIAAAIFVLTSISLTLLGGPESASSSVVGDIQDAPKPAATAPAEEATPEAEAAAEATEGEAAEGEAAAAAADEAEAHSEDDGHDHSAHEGEAGDAAESAPAETPAAPAQ